MAMKYMQAKFLISAEKLSQCPEYTLPEFPLLGRSNVGKSSFINGLANHKKLAKTSNTPGKTRLINFFDFSNKFMLADLPGYGYAKVSVEIRAKWGKMIERYLHGSPQLKKVFLLIDIRHVPSENDCMMYDWIVDNGYEPVIICTKLDKIKRSQVQKNLKLIREKLDLVPGTTMIPFSAQTKQGRDEIWNLIEETLAQEQQ